MRPLACFALVLVATALALPGSARAGKSKTWEKSWAVGPVPKVRIVTNEARVRIHRGEPGAVRTKIHYESRTWGLVSGERVPKVMLEQSGDVIRIEARETSNWVVFGGTETRFEMDVYVPPSCDLTARSGDGSITCAALEGRVTLESGDGRIRANGLKGTLVLWSGDGSIEADSLDGSLMARTTDGRLRVAGRFDQLDLRTGDGRIEATTRKGSKLSSPWSLQTGDGSIVLRIPRDLQAMLDASARDGSLRVDLPITTKGLIRNNELHGELNGGTVPLRLRSGDGSITLALAE